ncbi:hypothetical protein [Peribacillus kribbensis]|nr:hypothetical protein [Peribacillus kribbensis]
MAGISSDTAMPGFKQNILKPTIDHDKRTNKFRSIIAGSKQL